jgi:hypothetical protein
MPRNVRDAKLIVTKTLPASTTAVVSDAIDLEHVAAGRDFEDNMEVLLSAPLLTITELPDTKTMTYKLEHDDDVAFGGAANVYGSDLIVQTGATGGSAAAVTKRVRLPSDVKRYVRAKATPSGSGTGDCSGKSMTVEALF